METRWKRAIIKHAPEWEEYQIELPDDKNCLRVWRNGDNKWAMASLGRYVHAPVDTLGEAQQLCRNHALTLLRRWLAAVE